MPLCNSTLKIKVIIIVLEIETLNINKISYLLDLTYWNKEARELRDRARISYLVENVCT